MVFAADHLLFHNDVTSSNRVEEIYKWIDGAVLPAGAEAVILYWVLTVAMLLLSGLQLWICAFTEIRWP